MICMSSPFGGIPDLSGLMSFPPAWPRLPMHGLPTLPYPLFGNCNIPNLEMRMIAMEMQAMQFMHATAGMISPLLSILGGGGIDGFLPKLPGFGNINMSGLLSGELSHFAMIRNMGNFVPPGFSLPLYPTCKIPVIAAFHCGQIVVRDYMMSCINTIPDLVGQVTNFLDIGGMPSIPALPSMGVIMGAMMSQMSSLIPGVNSFAGMARAFAMGSFTMASLMSGISIPNFPSIPSFNYPTIPSITIPDIEIVMHTMAFTQHLMISALSPMSSFIGGITSLSIPTVCIPF